MLYLYIYLILKTDNAQAWVSQNLPWVGWRDETISQIEGAREREKEGERFVIHIIWCRGRGNYLRSSLLYSFSDVSFGDGMTAARSYSVTDYVISIKRLKMEDWRIIISVFKGCEWRDLDRKEGARREEDRVDGFWVLIQSSCTCILQENTVRVYDSLSALFTQTSLFSFAIVPSCSVLHAVVKRLV